MKYVATWTPRPSQTEEAQQRGLEVFSKWSPSEGTTFIEFLGRCDARGGYAVVETDRVELLTRDLAIFSPWFDTHLHPCVEIQDQAAIGMQAVEFRSSVKR